MTLDPGGPERDLGPGRVPYMWPLRTLLDRSTVLAFGTDSPVVDVNSMDVLYSAVTRQDPGTHEPAGGWLPDERIGMAEALRAYTQGSAAAAGRRRELGTRPQPAGLRSGGYPEDEGAGHVHGRPLRVRAVGSGEGDVAPVSSPHSHI